LKNNMARNDNEWGSMTAMTLKGGKEERKNDKK
jgi:hypothetical protein